MQKNIKTKLEKAFLAKKKPAWKQIFTADELEYLKNINTSKSISQNARNVLFPNENVLAPCGQEREFRGFVTGFNFSCIEKCHICKEEIKKARIKRFSNFNDQHGVKNCSQLKVIVEKRKQTCLRKYGKTTNLLTDETKRKIKETNLRRYGTENSASAYEVKLKKKKAYLEKYGVDNPSKSASVIEKIQKNKKKYYDLIRSQAKAKKRDHNLKTYGTIYPTTEDFQRVKFINNKGLLAWKVLKNPLYLEALLKKYTIEEISQKYNISFSSIAQHSIKYQIRKKYQSSFESSVVKHVLSLIGKIDLIKFNSRPKFMNGLELDIYVPSMNFAIECNGLYWHRLHDFDYHKNKTDLCNANGISLIHVWEDEWHDNKNEIKTAIKRRICKQGIDTTNHKDLLLPRDLYDDVNGFVRPPTERKSGGFNSGWVFVPAAKEDQKC